MIPGRATRAAMRVRFDSDLRAETRDAAVAYDWGTSRVDNRIRARIKVRKLVERERDDQN